MNPYSLLSLFSFVVALLLGVVVFISRSKDAVNRVFVFICGLLAYAAITELGFRLSPDSGQAAIWGHLGSFWYFLIPAVFHFSALFSNRLPILRNKWAIVALYAPALLLASLELGLNIFDNTLVKTYWGWTLEANNIYTVAIVSVWVLFQLIVTLYLLWSNYRSQTDRSDKRRALVVALFITFVIFVASITDLILPMTGIYILETTNIAFATGSLFVWYGVVRYRLFDIPMEQTAAKILLELRDFVIVADNKGYISYFNPAVINRLGYSKQELIKMPIGNILRHELWRGNSHPFNIETSCGTNTNLDDLVIYDKDGELQNMSVKVTPINDIFGGIKGCIVTANDITEQIKRIELETALLDKERATTGMLKEEINRRIEYTRALVHELKTPLTPVYASIGLLINQCKEDASIKLAKLIQKGVEDLNERIDELLDIARAEMHILTLKKRAIDYSELVQNVANEYSTLFSKKMIDLELQVPDDLPMVVCDEKRIRQVIKNILNNALKWSPDGCILHLKVHLNADHITTEIHDCGPGVSDEKKKTIFDPYYKREEDRPNLSGLGLGLSISKVIVEAHSGTIWVDDRNGGGSVFSFTIPIHE